MAINKRQSKKVIDHVRTEDAAGLRMDPGPHIGIVKHVVDSTRSGRLIVYLPHLGGDPDDVHNQRIVQYASPFFGYTNLQENPNGIANQQNTFETVRHTYGMWMTPPDVGVKVLVIFEAGDANNGYWFACIPPTAEHNMAVSGGGVSVDQLETDKSVEALIKETGTKFVPACEFNAASYKAFTPGVLQNNRPPHRVQTKILAEQGLLADPIRGIDDATTQRESPSGLFGISTPGRPYIDQATDDLLKQLSENVSVDRNKLKEKIDSGRKGGHQLIMDDGDVDGNQRRVRLRTAAGHQILLDDTHGIVYISNSSGNSWVELTPDGQVNVYSASDINIRSGNDINIKADRDISLHASRDIRMLSGNKYKTQTATMETNANSILTHASGNISVSAEQSYALSASGTIGLAANDELIINSNGGGWQGGNLLQIDAGALFLCSGSPGGALAPTVPSEFTVTNLNDTVKIGDVWQHTQPSEFTSNTILTKIPTHEPYNSGDIPKYVSETGKPSKGA